MPAARPPRIETVRASTSLQVLLITSEALARLPDTHPELGLMYLRMRVWALLTRLRNGVKRALMVERAPELLHGRLSTASCRYSERSDGEPEAHALAPSPSQQQHISVAHVSTTVNDHPLAVEVSMESSEERPFRNSRAVSFSAQMAHAYGPQAAGGGGQREARSVRAKSSLELVDADLMPLGRWPL